MIRDHALSLTVSLALSAVALLAGCPGADTATTKGGTAGPRPCAPFAVASCLCPGGGSATQVCAPDGLSYSACACAGVGNVPGGGGGPLPCDVSAVLQNKCWSCHGATLNYTAPMHLVSSGDFQAASHSNASVTVASQVKARIHSVQAPMPPPTMPQLTAAELATLDAWLDAGAAPAEELTQCPNPAADGGMGQGGMGEPPDGGAADGGMGPDVECYDFLAHAAGSDAPFPVPAGTTDLYNCFSFTPPWQGDLQGISFKSKIDKTPVVHHWLLYQNATAQTNGAVSACLGAHPDAALVAGWAVGGSDTVLPNDVGMQMGTNGFTLEVHYNNQTPQDLADASGVQVCVTKQARPHLAATHWIGTINLNLIGAGDVNSTCTPNYANGPITILSSWPHMHKHGTHMKSVINRAGGAPEVLIDKPFDFNYQVSYPTPTVLNAGDTIATTCTYGSGPVQFGEGTNQEMCFNFIVAWPAGSLSSLGANFTANQCFQ